MQPTLRLFSLFLLALCVPVLGCTRNALQRKESMPDPLLMSKTALPGKPTLGSTTRTAQRVPLPPSMPREARSMLTAQRKRHAPIRTVHLGFAPLANESTSENR